MFAEATAEGSLLPNNAGNKLKSNPDQFVFDCSSGMDGGGFLQKRQFDRLSRRRRRRRRGQCHVSFSPLQELTDYNAGVSGGNFFFF